MMSFSNVALVPYLVHALRHRVGRVADVRAAHHVADAAGALPERGLLLLQVFIDDRSLADRHGGT